MLLGYFIMQESRKNPSKNGLTKNHTQQVFVFDTTGNTDFQTNKLTHLILLFRFEV
jgi:hypothetical protein